MVEPDLVLAGLSIWGRSRELPDCKDYWDANWINVLARVEASGAVVEASGPWLRSDEIADFANQLGELHRDLKGSAELACMEPALNAKVECGSLGHVQVTVRITPDHLIQAHQFVFDIDQSYLPGVLRGCHRLLERFPVVGYPADAFPPPQEGACCNLQNAASAVVQEPLTVRRLTPADLVAMRALNALFGEAFADADSYAAQPPPDAYLEDLLGKKQVIVLAARVGGEVIGGLVAYELEKFERARRELYIYDLAVAQAHRRRGVATALIRQLQEIARARGACAVFVQADHGDDPAIALYEKLGVREEVLHFDLPVASG